MVFLSEIDVRSSHVFNKKAIDMVDDGGAGDIGGSFGGDQGRNGIHGGDVGNSVGGSGSTSDLLRQIGGCGSKGSNFVSCNFYIGIPPPVCDVLVDRGLIFFDQGGETKTEKSEKKIEDVGADTFREALRAIERAAEKKARHPFSSSKRTKKRSNVPACSFWLETDSVVSVSGIWIVWFLVLFAGF